MDLNKLTKRQKIKKLFRYISIYGWRRSINKAFARTRSNKIKKIYFLPRTKNVSIIGCGQFSFNCIAFFLAKIKGNIFLDGYDINSNHQTSLASFYQFNGANSAQDLLSNPKLKILYIASNHSTHADYAVKAMNQGVRKIYIEKPIATNMEQLNQLIKTQQKTGSTLYAGYNRPYSKAIRKLKQVVLASEKKTGGISLSFFVIGHDISKDHWYRNPEEGTRVCGNMGHWLDIAVHILAWRSIPERLKIQINYSNVDESDDNLSVTLSSDQQDIISIMMSSRDEPFEGINETVNFQYNSIIAKIDDFRRMTIWNDSDLINETYFPKDVGHKKAVLQPFEHKDNRDWKEVISSTLLMLKITEMVRNKDRESEFHFKEEYSRLTTFENQKFDTLS